MQQETKDALLDVVRVAVYDMLGVAFKAMPLDTSFYTSWAFSPPKGFLKKRDARCLEVVRIAENRWTLSVLYASKSVFGKVENRKELFKHMVDTNKLMGAIIALEEDRLLKVTYPRGVEGGFCPFGFLDFVRESKDKYPKDHILHHIHFIFSHTDFFEKIETYRQREVRDAVRKSTPKPS